MDSDSLEDGDDAGGVPGEIHRLRPFDHRTPSSCSPNTTSYHSAPARTSARSQPKHHRVHRRGSHPIDLAIQELPQDPDLEAKIFERGRLYAEEEAVGGKRMER